MALKSTDDLPHDGRHYRLTIRGGSPITATVINTKTGEDVTKLVGICYGARLSLVIGMGEPATLVVEPPIVGGKPERYVGVSVDADAGLHWQAKNPATGLYEPLAALVFRDGTQVDFALDGTPIVKPAGGR